MILSTPKFSMTFSISHNYVTMTCIIPSSYFKTFITIIYNIISQLFIQVLIKKIKIKLNGKWKNKINQVYYL